MSAMRLSRASTSAAYPDIVRVLAGKLSSEHGGIDSGANRIEKTVSKAIGRAMEQAGDWQK